MVTSVDMMPSHNLLLLIGTFGPPVKTVVAWLLDTRLSRTSGKTIEELVEIIKRDGTDRYDPKRGGDRYDNVEGKHIDLFLLRRKITEKSQFF